MTKYQKDWGKTYLINLAKIFSNTSVWDRGHGLWNLSSSNKGQHIFKAALVWPRD